MQMTVLIELQGDAYSYEYAYMDHAKDDAVNLPASYRKFRV
jgi:hypothetical protein